MKFKKLLHIMLWLLSLAMVVVLLVYSRKHYQRLRCQKMEMIIDIAGQDTLLYQRDIQSIIEQCCDSVITKRLRQINLEKLERTLQRHQYVASASVYNDLNGKITLHAVQHTPVIRVFNHQNESFYLNAKGEKISSQRPARVLVAHGFYGTDEQLRELLRLYHLINNDPFLRHQIGEVFRDSKGSYRLIPVVGEQEILLGYADNFEEGLSKLKLFYEQGMNDEAWKTYRKIDVRFRDQVVCSTKKEPLPASEFETLEAIDKNVNN